MSATLCQLGLALPAMSLWRATAAARCAIARGDVNTAAEMIGRISTIEDHARHTSLRAACASARRSILRAGSAALSPITQGAAS